MFATLGSIPLDVLSVTGLSISDKWEFSEHTVIEGKPKLQVVGGRLRDVGLKFRFHRDFCDPEAELLALRDIAVSQRAALLQLGTGRVIGRFVITDLSEESDWMLADGLAIAIACSVSLKEWAGDLSPAPVVRAVAGSPLARRPRPATAPTGDPGAVSSTVIVRA